jgi:monoterpene epsilon-lactone hydrolase
MASFQAGIVRVLLRNTVKNPLVRALRKPNLTRSYRKLIGGGETIFGRLPHGVTKVPVEERLAGVHGEWLLTHAEPFSPRVILYLHGGGYVGGTIQMYRSVTSAFALRCRARVFAVDYRLAPEHPFPAALDDSIAAYRWLLAEGIEASKIVVAGDSAGGGLTLSTLLAIRDRGLPRPAGAVMIAPWVDLLATGESIRTNARSDDVVVPDNGENRLAHAYMGGAPLDTPLASGLYADLAGLPPMLIQASAIEVLLDDAVRLDAKARAAGVDSTLQLWDGLPHVWHLFKVLPETREAFDDIAVFVRRVTVS